MPLHSGGSQGIFILCLIRNKMFFWLFLFLKPTHSPTALVYQLFESEIKLRAVSLFFWPLFMLKKGIWVSIFKLPGCWMLSMMGGQPCRPGGSMFTQLHCHDSWLSWLAPDHPRIMLFQSPKAREWSHCPILLLDNWGKGRCREVIFPAYSYTISGGVRTRHQFSRI